jgi:putative membrane protein
VARIGLAPKELHVINRLTVFFATATLTISAAQAADSLSAGDSKFIAMVSQGGMFEVAAGKVAADQGRTQDIKDQGLTEAHDHKLVGDKLTSIASANGVKLADSLNPQFQKELDDLTALSGAAFDRAYLHDMTDIHAKDGAAFAMEAKAGSNADLKAFAVETHRIVVRHIGELQAKP